MEEEVWADEETVLFPLAAVICRLQVNVSSRHAHFLFRVRFRMARRAEGKSSRPTLALLFLDCRAQCQADYWKEFTSQAWPPDRCP